MMGLQLRDKLKNMLEIAKVYDILAQPNNFDIVLLRIVVLCPQSKNPHCKHIHTTPQSQGGQLKGV